MGTHQPMEISMETGGEGRGMRRLENREGRPKVREGQASREVLSNGELSSLLGSQRQLCLQQVCPI